MNCPDETAECLRGVPVDKLIDKFPPAAIPGVVDGDVLTESIGSAFAGGRFTRVPILNGINHDEEFLFVAALGPAGATGCSWGCLRSPASYASAIAAVLGVAQGPPRCGRVPVAAYPLPRGLHHARLGCEFRVPALQIDRWASPRADLRVPVQRRHRTASLGTSRRVALHHSSELSYLFGLPNAPFPPA